nr:12747_t:CDS:2 [Entrophospora candida]
MGDKWRLFSGIFAEDALYNWAVTQRSETLAHSFILDTGCQKEKCWRSLKSSHDTIFERWEDIKSRAALRSRMDSFSVNALAEDNLEPWLVSHVWIFVIEVVLKDIEEIRIGKSDGGSSASKIRKNKKRKIGESFKEILAGKVARTGDIHDKKSLKDRMKLLKLMKDILDLIIESLPSTTIENYRRELAKSNLEAPIYIEGLCGLILSIITILELKNYKVKCDDESVFKLCKYTPSYLLSLERSYGGENND